MYEWRLKVRDRKALPAAPTEQQETVDVPKDDDCVFYLIRKAGAMAVRK